LMFFSKGPLGVSEARGPVSQGRRKISANRLMPLPLGQTLKMIAIQTVYASLVICTKKNSHETSLRFRCSV